MKERIIKLRKMEGISQASFAERIGLSRNFIGLVESGERNVSDRTISDICREFKVNESWLRTGEGEPYQKRTRTQEIGEFANKIMSESDDAFKKRFILALSKLDESDWETLAKIANELKEEG